MPAGAVSSSATLFDEAFLRKLERLVLLAKRVPPGLHRGERHTRRVGSGGEFADHREYVPGDDLRRLDWNLYGRLERPFVRLFDEDEELPFYLLVDTSASMGAGAPSKLRLAQELAAAIAYIGLAQLDLVSLYPLPEENGPGLGPVRGKGHVHLLLRALAGLRPSGSTGMGAAIGRFLVRHRRRGVAVLLSDLYDPSGHEEALDRLRHARFEPVVVQISAPEERRPPLGGDLVLVDVETGEERAMTITAGVKQEYERRFERRTEALVRFCREHAIPCFPVCATTPFEEIVLRLFRSGGLLG